MTNDNDLLQIKNESETRRAFGVMAVLAGVLLLAIAATGTWSRSESTSHEFVTLLSASSCITIFVALANLCRSRVLGGALLQAGFAFATMLSALLFAFAGTLGPSALASMFGAVLVAFGGIARINGEVLETAVAAESVGDGDRKWIYRDNRVVAVEQWVDGKLVSTRAVEPSIAR